MNEEKSYEIWCSKHEICEQEEPYFDEEKAQEDRHRLRYGDGDE